MDALRWKELTMPKSSTESPRKSARKKPAAKGFRNESFESIARELESMGVPLSDAPLSDNEIQRRFELSRNAKTRRERLLYLVGIACGPGTLSGDEVMHRIRDGEE